MKLSKRKFIRFLKQNNAYEQFMFNFRKQNPLCNNKELYFKSYSNADTLKYVDYAFVWDNTKEGWEYWANLDKKWKKEYTWESL